jgi:hypothetical protein
VGTAEEEAGVGGWGGIGQWYGMRRSVTGVPNIVARRGEAKRGPVIGDRIGGGGWAGAAAGGAGAGADACDAHCSAFPRAVDGRGLGPGGPSPASCRGGPQKGKSPQQPSVGRSRRSRPPDHRSAAGTTWAPRRSKSGSRWRPLGYPRARKKIWCSTAANQSVCSPSQNGG